MDGRLPFAALLVLWLTAGCAGLHSQKHMHPSVKFPRELPAACLAACDRQHLVPTHFVLVVQVSTQTTALYEDGRFSSEFPCSTSRYGIGQLAGSNCTPLGLHCIAEKFGAGEPAGTVFKSRQIVGHTSDPGLAGAGITTRIMWLDGLEPGFNRGGNVDTHARFVYIHGTADQAHIGRPASLGCTELADPDLIKLFDLLPSGTMVWIEE
jgi:hypothetical protein